MRAPPKVLTITDRAAARLREIMADAEEGVMGLRVGIRSTGCSGMSYKMEYATEAKKFEDRMVENGVTVLIEPTATMFLLGTEMDYVEEELGSRFVFNNPNEVDRCGCGESFRVAPELAEKATAAQ